jgi:hypothetical protein
MATDPTTQDQQVADRPDQTAPVPLPAGLQPDTHPMLTADGSQSGEVPISQMAAARAQGHHIAIPMQAPDPDNRTGFVPLHRVTDAVKAGFQHVGAYKHAIDSALDYVRDKRNDLAEAAAYGVAKRIPNFDSMPPEVQNDLKSMVGTGLGFYTGGLMGTAPTKEQLQESGRANRKELERAGVKIPTGIPDENFQVNADALPPVGIGEMGGIEPSEPAMQLGRVPERANLNRPALPSGETAPRTIDVQGTPDAKTTIEDAGMVYKGELSPGSGVHMVEHPNHPGKTTAVTEPVTPEKVNDAVGNVLTRFGVKADVPQTAQETLAQTTPPEDQRVELRNKQNRIAQKNAVREDRVRRQQEFEAAQPKAQPTQDQAIPSFDNPDDAIKHYEGRYKEVQEGDTVSGMKVRGQVDNMSSIAASIPNYEILDGLREVSMDDFPQPPVVNKRTQALASAIKNSGEITPLIVGFDQGGPYIVEGSHRYDALKINGAKSFPAVVVADRDEFGPGAAERATLPQGAESPGT